VRIYAEQFAWARCLLKHDKQCTLAQYISVGSESSALLGPITRHLFS